MSRPQVGAKECMALGAGQLALRAYPSRKARLGELEITRCLPIRDRRMVGPWCLLDYFGPLTFVGGRPMNVPPHPHIGLQTVTWLLEGEVLHSDSLGSQAVVRPGGVNVMTAGRGIAHAEETPFENGGRLNGVQLWVALPDSQRDVEPSFDHVEQVPIVEQRGGIVQVFADSLDASGPSAAAISSRLGGSAYAGNPLGQHLSDLVALDVKVHIGEAVEVGLSVGFEHAALLLEGDCSIEGQRIEERVLYYLGAGRLSLGVASRAGGRLLLIGGPPSAEQILMWWNFVARTPEEIAEARADWEAGRRFGEVVGEHAPRLRAPELLRFAWPNPIS